MSAPSRLEVATGSAPSTPRPTSADRQVPAAAAAWWRAACQHGVLHVGDLAQEFLRSGELALGGDQVRGGGIARGARFLHVGDGDQADFEALARLLELARNGIGRRLLRLHVVLAASTSK
jgi:hypothetical protein